MEKAPLLELCSTVLILIIMYIDGSKVRKLFRKDLSEIRKYLDCDTLSGEKLLPYLT